ncbi:hypothetical protein FNV43_RR14615 [Rhamnella rubrinervis]|uniref:Serpin domain-containing protein n=1 Tax=Rhamnella rubrinervis TaxID=2594499 RepID=A0A8K0MGH4_9ROSA|nr:hypothetical protein FNV43_RR14615 [Rhamnella rubrinervis]
MRGIKFIATARKFFKVTVVFSTLHAFYIPKFRFSFKFKASETTKEIGLELTFKPGELTEMVDGPNSDQLCVSGLFCKSFIEVNEEGTEAAASSAALSMFLSASSSPPTFVAGRPFLFTIREETHGMVFFIGALLKPLLDA